MARVFFTLPAHRLHTHLERIEKLAEVESIEHFDLRIYLANSWVSRSFCYMPRLLIGLRGRARPLASQMLLTTAGNLLFKIPADGLS
jgi:hypothetical protein